VTQGKRLSKWKLRAQNRGEKDLRGWKEKKSEPERPTWNQWEEKKSAKKDKKPEKRAGGCEVTPRD